MFDKLLPVAMTLVKWQSHTWPYSLWQNKIFRTKDKFNMSLKVNRTPDDSNNMILWKHLDKEMHAQK